MVSLIDNFAELQFSTDDVPERDRVAVWREVIGRKVVRLDIEPLPGRQFHSTVRLLTLPGLRVMTGQISDVRIARTGELIADGNDDFRFAVNLSGGETMAQRRREVELLDGEATVVSCAEPVQAVRSPGSYFGLHIPSAVLAAFVTNVEDAVSRPIPSGNQALRLLMSYVKLLEQDDALATPELRRTVATHLHDLAALAIGASRDAAVLANGRGARAARLRVIKINIVEHLARADLSINAMAQRYHLVPRYIQRLFEDEGTTFSEFVMAQRLSRSHRMLTDPRLSARSIGEIALACGFTDRSHFNRRFRQRYGASPSDVRAAALGQDCR